MIRKRTGRVLMSYFIAILLCFSAFATNMAGSTQIVLAEEMDQKNVSEKAAVGLQDAIVIDSENPNIYYNANSSMTDFRDETIYFVMTTRFYDGDTSNNVQCWDAQNLNTDDPPWRGDFKGLIQKLDYIKALGFTAIWITPVVENASGYDYHGYHAVNFEKVDSRYESDDCTYQDLIDAVHAKGMKIIQDVVFNHTGNWGEENLYPMFTKDENADLSDVSCMIRNMDMEWASDYDTFLPENQRGTYQLRDRLKLMNADSDAGKKYDINDIYHHFGFVGSSFEQPIVQYGSIHYADCMDLNTENPQVYHYLVDAYSQYIRMGVDAFRIDTVKHLSRLTFNEAFNQQLNDVYNEVHGTTGEGNFYMFGEVCTRWRGTWNSNIPSISSPFYTWKETKEYAWDDSETAAATATNNASAMQHYQDNASNVEAQPTSNNVYLNGNEYHAPDYSQASGLNVIDFPMHWAFKTAGEAYQQALAEDPYYNDSSFNVTYVDSHDYAPDNAPENKRYEGSQAQWAENLNLMFTFRGIPCIYYGSEIEFQKGCVIDPGPQTALAETGRAYFGDLIEGSVDVVDFAKYTNATGAMADTLNHPLSLHIQRLNRLRAAIPALRKGQYSTNGCNGSFAYKRRYTDATTDSFALIALSSDATFNNIPNGTYTDAITGDVKTVANGTLSTSGIKGQGDLRVYVLDTALTKAPGMIEGFSDYMSGGKDVVIEVKEPTGISLDKTSADLDLGGTERFTATVLPSDATNKTVSWSSSNPSVATVSSNGLVTAKGEGTATIYAATSNAAAADYDKQSGLVATATITVKASGILVTSVTLNPSSVTLETGDTAQINAAIAPANASPQYTALSWSSSDTAVARVNNEGLVTAVKPGTATITAITVSGVSAKVDVEVTGKTVIIYGNAIYFEKPSGWGGNINAYFWSEDGSGWKNAGWPGTAMILTDEENGIYGMEWPEGKENAAIKVIFNDGGNQTADLDAVINGYFNQNGYVKTVPVNEKPSDANIQVAFADSSTVYTYDGTQQKPEVIVTNNGIKLSEGKDYVVNYKNNVNACDKTAGASAPTVTVTGKGTYADAVIERNSLTFTIQQKSLDADGVTVAVKTQEAVYTGERIEPEVTVTDTKGVITADDYEVTYSNNIRVGTAKVTVAGRGNYTGTVEKSFKIVKQNLPPNAPQTKMSVSVELGKLSAVALPENWRWSQVDENKSIQLGENFTATAVYIGNDQDNYEKLTVQVTIIGINCEHKEESKREIRNKIAPTCTEAGYSGDTYCTVCQTKLSDGEILEAVGHKWNGKPAIDKAATCTEAGSRSIHCSVCDAVKAGSTEAVPALGHTGGTATCSQLALCNRCHKKYGGLDADNHVHTGVKNKVTATCTAEGYTGDSYCLDCNKTLSIGWSIEKTAHNWDTGKVTKQATTTTEGVKIYTCMVCGGIKTEVITVAGGMTTEKVEAEKNDLSIVTIHTSQTIKKGSIITDLATEAVFRVTKSAGSTKTVEYLVSFSDNTKVVVPDEAVLNGVTYKVTSVASEAFKNNKKVKQLTIGKNVTTIGKNAFSNCTKLEQVAMNTKLTAISDKAFYKCTKLKAITIPSKVNKIGKQAFYGCKNLKNITIRTTKLTNKKVGSKAFKGIYSKAIITVPKSKYKAYKALLKAKGVTSKAKIKK